MKASELRIGNLVEYEYPSHDYPKDAEWGIYPIRGEDIAEFDESIFRPIALTEEWLVRFGFSLSVNKIIENRFIRDVSYEYSLGTLKLDCSGGISASTNIYSVHQLQNLYFALTQTELTIRP